MSKRITTNVARVCGAGLAGLAIAIASPSLADTAFGPRTVIGKDYQQMSFTRSADGFTRGSCQETTHCYVLFQRVPQRKGLVIQHVSCRVTVTPGKLVLATLATRKGRTSPLRDTTLLAQQMHDVGWIIDRQVKHLIEPGERPVVLFLVTQPNSISGLACTISGRLAEP